MKYNKSLFLYLTLVLSTLSIVLAGCSKEEDMEIPPQVPFFMQNSGRGEYTIATPTTIFKIPVGLTTPSNSETTVNFSVNSTTGAVQGTHYTLNKTTLTFPAGVVTDTIVVTGTYNQYLAGRKDTLVFSITDAKGVTSTLKSTYSLAISGPCFDGNVPNISVMSGTYANAVEPAGTGDPYTVTVGNITMTGDKKGTAQIANLWDYFGPVTINFDWSDPNNTIVSIPYQQTNQEYAAGQPFMIRTSPGKASKFSVCNNRISLTVDIIVNNYPSAGSAAYYERDYTITINR